MTARRLLAVAVGAALLTSGCSSAPSKAPANGAPNARTKPVAATSQATIVVANKVAIGSQSYVEDSSPAYLSTVPQPFCARNGCKVPQSNLVTGLRLTADCTVSGAQMYNYDLREQGAGNPHAAASNLWYHVVLPHDVSGYLSEVYVDAGSRGGQGLATCR